MNLFIKKLWVKVKNFLYLLISLYPVVLLGELKENKELAPWLLWTLFPYLLFLPWIVYKIFRWILKKWKLSRMPGSSIGKELKKKLCIYLFER